MILFSLFFSPVCLRFSVALDRHVIRFLIRTFLPMTAKNSLFGTREYHKMT